MRNFVLRLIDLLDERSKTISRVGVMLIFVLGVGYSIMLGDTIRFADERDYMEIARNIVEHGEFSRKQGTPTAYRPPLYPLLLASLASLKVPVVGMRIVNFLLLGLSALLLSKITLAAGQRIAAALIPFVVLGYPLFLYTAGTLYPQTFSGFLLCLFFYFLCHPQQTTARMCAAGVSFGLSILAVALHLLLLPVLLLWSLATRAIHIRRMLMICLIAALVTLPWLGRNYVTFDTFPLFGTNSGVNLLLGNSRNTTPNSGVRVDISEFQADASGFDELGRNKFYTEKAVENFIGDPSKYVILYFRKVLNWFNVNPNLATSDQQNWIQVAVLAISYFVFIVVVLLRLWYSGRKPLTLFEGLSLAFYISAAAAYAVFFTRIRFRVPFDLLLVGSVAHALSILAIEIFRPRASRSQESVSHKR